jgi:hypothetical protein
MVEWFDGWYLNLKEPVNIRIAGNFGVPTIKQLKPSNNQTIHFSYFSL